MNQNMHQVRTASWSIVKEYGFESNENLPVMDNDIRIRSTQEIYERLCALHAVVAKSYGFENAKEWLLQEHLTHRLTQRDLLFIEGQGSEQEIAHYNTQVCALWGLAWVIKIVPVFDFAEDCPEDFVLALPDLLNMESKDRVFAMAGLRDVPEIVRKLDLAYCLDWALTNAALIRQFPPQANRFSYCKERRHALEWVASQEDWDEVDMST